MAVPCQKCGITGQVYQINCWQHNKHSVCRPCNQLCGRSVDCSLLEISDLQYAVNMSWHGKIYELVRNGADPTLLDLKKKDGLATARLEQIFEKAMAARNAASAPQ